MLTELYRLEISDSGQSSSNTIDIGPDEVGNAMILAWIDNTKVVLNYTTTMTTSTTTPTSIPTSSIPTLSPGDMTTDSPSSTPTGASERRRLKLRLVFATSIAILFIA
jgi:hypothetical protein